MKKISKLFALLLVLAMMASLVACDSGKETIIGKWNCEMNIGEAIGAYMEESAGASGLAPDTELRMNLILEFKDDGKAEMTVKVNEDDFKKYIEELCDKMIDYLYDTLAAQGLSESDVDALIQMQYGMTMREYVDENMETAMDDALDQITNTSTMYYKLDEEAGVIYTAETEEELEEKAEGFEYKLDGNKLTIVNVLEDGEIAENPLEQYGLALPWVFKKQ